MSERELPERERHAAIKGCAPVRPEIVAHLERMVAKQADADAVEPAVYQSKTRGGILFDNPLMKPYRESMGIKSFPADVPVAAIQHGLVDHLGTFDGGDFHWYEADGTEITDPERIAGLEALNPEGAYHLGNY